MGRDIRRQSLLSRVPDDTLNAAIKKPRHAGIGKNKPPALIDGINRVRCTFEQSREHASSGMQRTHGACDLRETNDLARLVFHPEEDTFRKDPALITTDVPSHVGGTPLLPRFFDLFLGGAGGPILGCED